MILGNFWKNNGVSTQNLKTKIEIFGKLGLF